MIAAVKSKISALVAENAELYKGEHYHPILFDTETPEDLQHPLALGHLFRLKTLYCSSSLMSKIFVIQKLATTTNGLTQDLLVKLKTQMTQVCA